MAEITQGGTYADEPTSARLWRDRAVAEATAYGMACDARDQALAERDALQRGLRDAEDETADVVFRKDGRIDELEQYVADLEEEGLYLKDRIADLEADAKMDLVEVDEAHRRIGELEHDVRKVEDDNDRLSRENAELEQLVPWGEL